MIKYIEDFHLVVKVSIPTSIRFEEYVMNMSIDVVNEMLSRFSKKSMKNYLLKDFKQHLKKIK